MDPRAVGTPWNVGTERQDVALAGPLVGDDLRQAERSANAALIAEAPALVEALEAVLGRAVQRGVVSVELDEARAVLDRLPWADPVPRRSRREAIATVLGWDVADIDRYQPGRTVVPVYLAGATYVVALRAAEQAPEGVVDEWEPLPVTFGYRVLRGVEGAVADDTTGETDFERMARGLGPRGR